MKIVRENINFERGRDPKSAMGIGSRELIKEWMESMPFIIHEDLYRINEDMTITIKDLPLSLMGEKYLFPDGKLPSYIRFRECFDELDVDDCDLVSLEGFPSKIGGYFSCQLNNLTSLEKGPKFVGESYYCNGNPGKFTEDYVRKICEVNNAVQAEDTPDW